MENATKALIIAGAILVSILLVTMGITLLSNTSSLSDRNNSEVNSLTVKSFNNKIEPSCGDNVLGSTVAEMLDTVALELRNNTDLEFTVEYNGNSASTPDDIDTMRKSIRKTARYSVEVSEKDSQGYIKKVTIATK